MVNIIDEEVLRQELYDFYSDLDDAFVQRLKELCIIHDKTEEDMVSSWMAFVSKRSISSAPTLDLVDQFEHDELNKQAQNAHKLSSKAAKKAASKANTSSNAMFDKGDFISEINANLGLKFHKTVEKVQDNKVEKEEKKLLEKKESVKTTTFEIAKEDEEKVEEKSEEMLDENNGSKTLISDDDFEMVDMVETQVEKLNEIKVEPESRVPIDNMDVSCNVSKSYMVDDSMTINANVTLEAIEEENATQSSSQSSVICYYGNSQSDQEWKSDESGMSCNHTLDYFDKENFALNEYKFMSLKIAECNQVLNANIDEMADVFSECLDIDNWGKFSQDKGSNVEGFYVGRVKCDSNKDKLDDKSVLIEGSSQITNSQMIRLDLSQLEAFSLFPGQIIACKATNEAGKSLIVHKFVETHTSIAPFSTTPPTLKAPLNIVIAFGPFDTHNTVDNKYLKEALSYVKQYQPDYIILLGPFVDSLNPGLGNIKEDSLEKYFKSKMSFISNQLKNCKTEAIIIPSTNDLHHFSVIPTPPFKAINLPKLHFYPNPCMISIDGVVIGLTSTDILMHLTKQEIGINQPPDRLARLSHHILSQRNFYPLFPPSNDINLELTKYDYLQFPVTPHLLILPSALKQFVKNISHSIVVNPGRCSKGLMARIRIDPTGDSKYEGSLEAFINVEINKL